jgi:glycosyltransferase involved in cell wall biosynthesis
MKTLYVSTLCSDKVFDSIFENSDTKPTTHQVQKFHRLLVKGLSKEFEEIYILSKPPINRTTKLKKPLNEEESYENITFRYLKSIQFPILNYLGVFIKGFFCTIKWIYENRKEEKVIVCDVLNLSAGTAAFLAAKICRVKSMAIVLDVPNFIQSYTREKGSILTRLFYKFYNNIINSTLKSYDYYVFLTEQMNKLLNPSAKPYIVVEGIVDLNMQNVNNTLENKNEEKIVMYAGALREKYGVKNLIESFIRLEDTNIRLWLFGSGEMEDEIKNYEKSDQRICYFGNVLNQEVVKKQLSATLLVNPRPSNEEFTKYSFPSKNMEYMGSGTPIVTTPLPGMPREYYDYVYLFQDETIEGMSETLNEILGKSKKELHEQGVKAKQFVINNKNFLVQGNKVSNLIKNNLKL